MKISTCFSMIVALTLAVGPGRPALANGVTERVSVNSRGKQGRLDSFGGAMTRNGRYVVFDSDANNLVANDTNEATDVFLRDRVAGRTFRVSVGRNGQQGRLGGFFGSISANGRYVLFNSDADNLVPNDKNDTTDVFVRDLRSGTLRRINVGANGREANARSFGNRISADGRYAVFASEADNLVPNDTNGVQDIFVRDLENAITRRVSVRTGGRQANGPSFGGSITPDGRLIAFSSEATDLVAGDHNTTSDVFVHDRARGITERVSVASDETEAEPFSFSFGESLSDDGRYVAFQSGAGNLVPNDTNFATDVFIRDRREGKTERLVLAPPGGSPDPGSVGAVLSADGRFIAVSALGSFDAFIVDRRSGKARLINQPLTGALQPFKTSFALTVSRDGRRVAFQSDASNLVAGDTNDRLDVFVRDLSPW